MRISRSRLSSRCWTRSAPCLSVLTFAVGALGSISLLVGGVGIFTIMTIGVSERTAEIGLASRARRAEESGAAGVSFRRRLCCRRSVELRACWRAWESAAALDIAVPALPVSYSPMFIIAAESLPLAVRLISRHLCRQYEQRD